MRDFKLMDYKKIKGIEKKCIKCKVRKICEYQIKQLSVGDAMKTSLKEVKAIIADMKNEGSVYLCKDCAVLLKI